MSEDVRAYLERELRASSLVIAGIEAFRERHGAESGARVRRPSMPYIGADVFDRAASALLEGANLLLSGPKASGKNILADNLAYAFGRPVYSVSFHVNIDSSALIGADTFEDGAVKFRKGPVYLCAELGGFGIFDEVNMAKNESVAVLHSALDHRRVMDVPGYDLIQLSDATRFIGTMNYGYAGTRELNEALVSRFLVVDMPAPSEETLSAIIRNVHPTIRPDALKQLCGVFLDLADKNANGELSTKPLDLRGLISGIGLVRYGVSAKEAMKMGLANKSFDSFERDIIDDALSTRIPDDWHEREIFS